MEYEVFETTLINDEIFFHKNYNHVIVNLSFKVFTHIHLNMHIIGVCDREKTVILLITWSECKPDINL